MPYVTVGLRELYLVFFKEEPWMRMKRGCSAEGMRWFTVQFGIGGVFAELVGDVLHAQWFIEAEAEAQRQPSLRTLVF